MNEPRHLLSRLPAVDLLLHTPPLDTASHALAVSAARRVLDEARQTLLSGRAIDISAGALAKKARDLLCLDQQPALQPVLNLTGTILHTNLGRALLAPSARSAALNAASKACNLEFDLDTGSRGHRDSLAEEVLCRLTGCEAATVVNNNAGAVLIVLAALAAGREAIVSRGELVEIGGSFRIPDVMSQSGVRLVEVGSTNKTKVSDYRRALSPETALLLKVHTSNYRILGFTESVATADLCRLGAEHGIPVVEDLGSGMLIDLSEYGLPKEPTVTETLRAGVDLVTFSGDKLLGGPQAGIIAGRRDAVEKVRRHPLMRALRCDKMTLAALEATLRLYLDPQQALAEIPTLQRIALRPDELLQRCRRLKRRISRICGAALSVEIVSEGSAIGGGALPLTELPGYALALTFANTGINAAAAALRQGDPPVIGRIRDDRLILNPRTLAVNEEALLLEALRRTVALS